MVSATYYWYLIYVMNCLHSFYNSYQPHNTIYKYNYYYHIILGIIFILKVNPRT